MSRNKQLESKSHKGISCFTQPSLGYNWFTISYYEITGSHKWSCVLVAISLNCATSSDSILTSMSTFKIKVERVEVGDIQILFSPTVSCVVES